MHELLHSEFELIKLNINKCKIVFYGANTDHSNSYHINNAQLELIDKHIVVKLLRLIRS